MNVKKIPFKLYVGEGEVSQAVEPISINESLAVADHPRVRPLYSTFYFMIFLFLFFAFLGLRKKLQRFTTTLMLVSLVQTWQI